MTTPHSGSEKIEIMDQPSASRMFWIKPLDSNKILCLERKRKLLSLSSCNGLQYNKAPPPPPEASGQYFEQKDLCREDAH